MSTKPLVSKNYFLGVYFIVIFLSLSNGCFLTTGLITRGNYTTISVSEAKDLIVSDNELFILDVRTNEEFNDGHILKTKCADLFIISYHPSLLQQKTEKHPCYESIYHFSVHFRLPPE